MKLEEIIQITTNKIVNLRNLRQQAVTVGDMASVESIDSQITETEITLTQLQSKNE